MASDSRLARSGSAHGPLAPGKLIRIARGALALDIAPDAGGRIAQIVHAGVEWLVGYSYANTAMIAWGCYPMLPWAGRIRHGRFDFDNKRYELAINLDDHAIHGVGFAMPWRVETHSQHHVELSLQLPEDARWPFGGSARQRIEVATEKSLRMQLSVTAGERAMPAVIGWHPWFSKPDRLDFQPSAFYPRDAEGIAIRPLAPPPPGPWDDCFVNTKAVVLHRDGQHLRLTSDCTHWVIYDAPAHATCIEPQSDPPDAFNLEPVAIAPGNSLAAWFLLEWL
jgi:aldose 1-epimerase